MFFCLEGDLETTASHAKSHGVHINVVFLCGPIADVVVFGPSVEIVINRWIIEWPCSLLILVYGYVDLDLATSAGANVCGQGRKTDMGVRDLVGQELGPQFVAVQRVLGSNGALFSTQSWEGSQSDGKLAGFHVLLCDFEPPLHVWLDVEQILEINSPWFSRSGFEHETAKLGMEDGRSLAGSFWATLNLVYTTTLGEEFLIASQSLENICLA